jgi:hypothetical protein
VKFALAYFYIFSPIPSDFVHSIEWKTSLIKFVDDGSDSIHIDLQVNAFPNGLTNAAAPVACAGLSELPQPWTPGFAF